jgi:protein TonB
MRRSSTTFWCFGALGAIALHAGSAVLAYSNFQTLDSEADDGAPAMEISMAFEAPRLEPTDLPPGPEAEASAAAAAAVEQTSKAEGTPLPKEQPTESENPDRVVAQEEVKDPIERVPEKTQVRTQASTEAVASEATAPPTIEEAREAPKAVAPVQGSGQSANRIVSTWQKKLVSHLDRNKRYPSGANPRSVEVVVAFTLDRLGHVIASRIAKGSGDSSFDNAALEMMKRADPVPAPPPIIADDGLTFTLPVQFRAQGRS